MRCGLGILLACLLYARLNFFFFIFCSSFPFCFGLPPLAWRMIWTDDGRTSITLVQKQYS